MKRCPECSRTFPDSERFCASDGTALVDEAAAPIQGVASTQQITAPELSPEPSIECPVCGGKALPGEEVCSFCGARLSADESPPTVSTPSTPPPAATARQTTKEVGTENRLPSGTFDDERPYREEPSSVGRFFVLLGYVLAALVALAAGAWFALQLSSGPSKQVATGHTAAPSASPAVVESGPIAALATGASVQVTGESASDPARNSDTARKLFSDHNGEVLDVYRRALAADPNFHDGLLLTLTVTPDGTANSGSVKTSTASNPALDSDLVKTMMGWSFPRFSGSSVEISYPVVLARNAAEQGTVDSDLADKIAHLSPTESPEYASAPSAPIATPASVPSIASVSRPEPMETPAIAALERPPPHLTPEKRHKPRTTVARPPKIPPPSLLQNVQERLRSDRRLGRVKAYTNGGVVTVYGKVFDDKTKQLAVHTVRSVSGVTDVIDNLRTDTADWADQESKIMSALQGAGLGKVSVRVIGHDAYLSGEVSSAEQSDHAVTVAESAAPVRVRTNLIRVVPKGIFGF